MRGVAPDGDVIATAIAVVLKADDDHEILHRQIGVDRYDAVVEGHYAALAKKAWKYPFVPPLPSIFNVEPED